jgi:glycosyltransferase involved in cell wall biosynthesis
LSSRNDIAIYSPFASPLYEDGASRPAERRGKAGGAELQATFLARQLARRGLRVAHIVYPLRAAASRELPSLEVVERRPRRVTRRRSRIVLAFVKLVDAARIWSALKAADARLYLFRTGLSGSIAGFATGALFCLLHRRRLAFAASNDLDFIFNRDDRPRLIEVLYRLGLRQARCVVVQTRRQEELAARALDSSKLASIPSFAEPAAARDCSADHEAFLWAGRLVAYKLPIRYLELARSVPEARFRMILAETGETREGLAAEFNEAAAQVLNLQLEPRQSRERVLELIGRSVAVVVTSRHEGMPNLFLEAWARGVPVLSLHFDPDGRIAEEGLGICAAGSWPRFVSAARQLWSDDALRRDLGERGRDYVRRVHSLDVVADRWDRVLRGMLD